MSGTNDLRLEWLTAKELADNPANWRRHPSAQSNALEGVMAEVGWAGALLYNEATGRLIDGHLRKKVSKGQKMPVLIGSWTEEQERKILLTLDPIAAMADRDQDQLLSLLQDTQFESDAVNAMLEALANGETQPMPALYEPSEDPGAQIDRAEELRVKWGTERGQVWEIGRHRLMCGDSTVDALVGIDVIVTDPPYGVSYDPQAMFVHDEHHPAPNALTGMPGDDGTLDVSFLWEYPRRLVWGFPHIIDPQSQGWLVWDKHPGLEGESIGNPVEMAVTNLWKGFRIVRVLWGGYYKAAGEERGSHPTQKPIGVIKPWIDMFVKPDEIVGDPFLGSGTTMVAAEQLGRICYGMEIEPKYVAVALERMAGMGLEPKLASG